MFERLSRGKMLVGVLAACQMMCGPAGSGAQPGMMTGQVVDTQGKPLAGVTVEANNTLFDTTPTVTTTTGADGRYKVQVPRSSSWRPYAYMSRTYNGRTYKLDLHPDVADSFPGDTGGVRNFRWKLTGDKPAPLQGKYGMTLYVQPDPDAPSDIENFKLTLTPLGPLVDGSTGKELKVSTSYAQQSLVEDIPLGRYKLTASYEPPGKASRPMVVDAVRMGPQQWADSVTVEFEPEGRNCSNCFRLMLNLPEQ